MKLRAIIIDDEESCRDTLRDLLRNHFPHFQIVKECDSVESGIAALRGAEIDVLFLDVELPDGSGFDVLSALEDIRFKTIFTTAHNEYAVKAIKFSALDYLLKPILVDDLTAALARIDRTPEAQEQQRAQLRILHDRLVSRDDGEDRIALPTQDGYSFVDLRDIIRCEAENNYTWVFLVRGAKLLVCRTMKEFDEMLEEHGFFRIHNSHLINLRHLKRYVKGKGGYVVMSDDNELEVSVRRKDDFIGRISR
jgi:two-component system, LytTR family, response regulator